MITTIQTCDRCKRDLEKGESLIAVGVVYCFGPSISPYSGSTIHSSDSEAQWCRTCMIKMGLLHHDAHGNQVKTPEPLPTLEDLIREIVREEIQGGAG